MLKYVVLVLLMFGCAQSLTSAQVARIEKFECQARALAPHVKGVYDERELLKDLIAGRANLTAVIVNPGLTPRELAELDADLSLCDPPLPVPKGSPS